MGEIGLRGRSTAARAWMFIVREPSTASHSVYDVNRYVHMGYTTQKAGETSKLAPRSSPFPSQRETLWYLSSPTRRGFATRSVWTEPRRCADTHSQPAMLASVAPMSSRVRYLRALEEFPEVLCEVAFEAAERFAFGFSFGGSAVEVGACVGVCAGA
jgi:hypothetical protein